MTDSNGWEALFGSTEEDQKADGQRGSSSPDSVHDFRRLPGVQGVVQVAPNGVILGDDIEGDPNRLGAVAAYIASFAGQINRMLNLGVLTYALLAHGEQDEPFMVIRRQETLYGLLLDDSRTAMSSSFRWSARTAQAH